MQQSRPADLQLGSAREWDQEITGVFVSQNGAAAMDGQDRRANYHQLADDVRLIWTRYLLVENHSWERPSVRPIEAWFPGGKLRIGMGQIVEDFVMPTRRPVLGRLYRVRLRRFQFGGSDAMRVVSIHSLAPHDLDSAPATGFDDSLPLELPCWLVAKYGGRVCYTPYHEFMFHETFFGHKNLVDYGDNKWDGGTGTEFHDEMMSTCISAQSEWWVKTNKAPQIKHNFWNTNLLPQKVLAGPTDFDLIPLNPQMPGVSGIGMYNTFAHLAFVRRVRSENIGFMPSIWTCSRGPFSNIRSAQIWMSNNVSWEFNPVNLSVPKIWGTLLHEWGHVIGLDERNPEECIAFADALMRGTFGENVSDTHNAAFTSADLFSLKILYPDEDCGHSGTGKKADAKWLDDCE